MARRPPRLPLLLLAALAGAAAAQDDITVYRCTDANGHLTLQDGPCAGGQAQQTMRMLQPVDPPPRAAPEASIVPASEPAPPPVAVASPSQPMYECVRPDGSRYTSDDAEGNPRWVSGGWSDREGPSLDVPHLVRADVLRADALVAAAQESTGNPRPRFRLRPVEPPPPPPPPPPGHGHGHHGGHGGHGWNYGHGGGHWEYDDCHALPQADACTILRERREGIRTRFFNAQANERATLDREERAINARLASDCGGS
jgi:hypothetical protein